MEYTKEDLSPVKKKITITVSKTESNAAIASAVAMYRSSVTLDGFRKGKVPASIIEKRFGDNIYHEASTNVVNANISEVLEKEKITPVSRIELDGGQIERDKDFVYSISFEVMPEFTLPKYEGLEVDQEEALVDESEVESVIERLLTSMAEIVPVEPARKAQKGDIAIVDFSSFDEAGKPVEGVSATNFQLPLGEGQTLQDFEDLVCSMTPGDETEGPVTFPDDFFNPEFAGKKVTMKVKLHELKTRILPELTDEIAKKAGNFDSVEKLRESIQESYLNSKTQFNKNETEKKLLDTLLEKADFPLPESIVNSHINGLLGEMNEKLQRQGESLQSQGKTEEELTAEVRPEAEMRAKMSVLLLSIAKAADLTVTDQEVDMMLRRMAMQGGQDYKALRDYYEKNNLFYALRDRILADKAMDEIYSKAKVTMTPAKKDKEAKAPKEKKASTKTSSKKESK